MCQHAGLVLGVVNEFINQSKMFTAHGVTKEVRNRTKDKVIHNEIKGEVHGLFNNGNMFNYNRTLANIQGANPQPWIYHPLSIAPSLVTAIFGNPPTNTVADTTNLTQSITATISTTNGSSYKLDSTNRLCIPARLIRQMGLKPGNEVGVFGENNELVLRKGIVAGVLTSYVVDSYDNVRLTLSALRKGGLRVNGNFDINGNSTAIKVKNA